MKNYFSELKISRKQQKMVLGNDISINWHSGSKNFNIITDFSTVDCVGVPFDLEAASRYFEAPCLISASVFNNDSMSGDTKVKEGFYDVKKYHVDIGIKSYSYGYESDSSGIVLRFEDDSRGSYKIKLIIMEKGRTTKRCPSKRCKVLYKFKATSIDSLIEYVQNSVVDLYSNWVFMPLKSLHSVIQVPDGFIKNLKVYKNHGEKIFNVEKTVEQKTNDFGKHYTVNFILRDLVDVQTSDTSVLSKIRSKILSKIGSNILSKIGSKILNGEQNFGAIGEIFENLDVESFFNSKPPNAYFTLSTLSGKLIYKSSILPETNDPKWNDCEFFIPNDVQRVIFTVFHAEKENNGDLGMLDVEKVIGLAVFEMDTEDVLIFGEYMINEGLNQGLNNLFKFSEVEIVNSRDVVVSHQQNWWNFG